VTLEFNIGDSIALMGANGAGKTTLIRSILGYYQIDGGSISVNGLNPTLQREEVLKIVSFVPQLPPPIRLSLDELIGYIEKSSNTARSAILHYSNELKLDIKSNINKSFFKLSGGMKQKLLIAISLARGSKIMIFDEPTANLDPKGRDDFYRLLQNRGEGRVLLFVTHRVEELKGLVNREIYMDLGSVVSDERI
jgi:ABC-2 type transport system ATP-binding protein